MAPDMIWQCRLRLDMVPAGACVTGARIMVLALSMYYCMIPRYHRALPPSKPGVGEDTECFCDDNDRLSQGVSLITFFEKVWILNIL